MNREERLEQLLTATVKLLDRWEEYSLETFLSTPSARRATVLRRGGVLGARISIHALREEGDQVPCVSFPLTS